MRFFSLFITVCIALSTWGRSISPEEALQRIRGNSSSAPGLSGLKDQQPQLLMTGYSEERHPAYYIFDRAGSEGYMILSADDVAMPMLGYSTTTSIDVNDIPDNLKDWLEGYAEEIAWASEREAMGLYNVDLAQPASRRTEKAPISPLCTTKWNQGDPFNLDVPTITSNGSTVRCATGCVATAMAQLMKFHEHPLVGKGSNSYTWTRPDTNSEETLSMNFSQTEFDWDNMLSVYIPGYYNDTQTQAVATLMKACGYSVNMGYGPSSGAATAQVAQALVQYFGYSYTTKFEYRQYYDYYTWVDKIYDNLLNVGPLVFSGRNDGGGHAFIIDGYNGDGYFHTNWGWGGMSDGYFRITALDPSAQGIGGSAAGYNQNQGAIFGARPATSEEVYTPVFKLGISDTLTAQITDGTLTIQGIIRNIGDTSSDINTGLQFCNYNTDNAIQTIFYTNIGSWPTLSYLPYISVAIPTDLPADTYKVYPVACADGAEEWEKGAPSVGNRNYIVMVKAADGTCSIETLDQPVFHINNLDVTTAVYLNQPFAITADAVNQSDTEVLQEVRLCFISGSSVSAQCSTMVVDVPAGETESLSNTYSITNGSVEAGKTYQLGFVDINTGRLLSNLVSVTIQDDPGQGVLSASTFSIRNSQAVTLDDFCIDYSVTCTSGLYASPIYVLIFNEDLKGSYIDYAVTQSLFVETGKTVNVSDEKTSALTRLEIGQRYAAALFYVKDNSLHQLSWPEFFTVHDIVTGIDHVTSDSATATVSHTLIGETLILSSDGEILSVEVYDTSGRKVAASTSAEVDLSGTTHGIYLAHVLTANGHATIKFVK